MHTDKNRTTNKSGIIVGALVSVAALLIIAGALLTNEYFSQQRAYALYIEEQEARKQLMQEATSGDMFFNGVYVEGVAVGGMTLSEARDAVVDAVMGRYRGKVIEVHTGGEVVGISTDALIIETNVDEALNTAYAIGRSGATLEDNYAQVTALDDTPAHFSLEVSAKFADTDDITETVGEIVSQAAIDALFAGYDRETGTVSVTPEASGAALDADALLSDIQAAIDAGELTRPIEAKTIEIAPAVTEEDVRRDFVLMGSFQTVAKKDSNRNVNIGLAMAAINGHEMKPGDIFSCNGVIGQRTPEKGYQLAGAIENGVMIKAYGGGVCQVSSTLYNAVARAGLEIVERKPHSIPSDYVGLGMDATIDWPSLDFKFKNNTEANVYIFTDFDLETRTLTIEIYGRRIYPENVRVELRSEYIKSLPQPVDAITYDPLRYVGDIEITREGRSGSEVQSYLQFFDEDGNLISEEKYHYSVYNPRSTKMIVGTRPLEE